MTREEARIRGEMMISYANGDEWEMVSLNGKWYAITKPNFDGPLATYRKKPKPECRPWTRETFPDVPFQSITGDVILFRATSWCAGGVYFMLGKKEEVFRTWAELFEHFEQRDGSPCGEVVK